MMNGTFSLAVEERFDVFTERIKDLIFENKLSVKELSEKSGVGLSNVYYILKGEHYPSVKTAVALADFFLCPLDYLFGFLSDFTPKRYRIVEPIFKRFQKAVESSGKSRYELSRTLGLTEQRLSSWYLGHSEPNAEHVVLLALATDCSVDFLIGREIDN